ncbi:MAG: tetratricopeptide repeat protein, partial [Planctomycetota bacterium]|nr:tetratricopeptide repeat protein [Planctomycetota bacterium]
MLYELLTGELPFNSHELRKAALAEVARIIKEVTPPKPSTRLAQLAGERTTTIAAARSASRERITSELRRELDWIPLMALRKERERRYASPQALADDVQRYLEGRPLRAAPDSKAYLARKFVRRNKVQVFAASAVFVALSAGLAVALWQRSEAVRQRDAAEARRAEIERIANYLRAPLETLQAAAWRSDGLRDAENRAQAIAGTKENQGWSEAELNAVNLAAVALSQFDALKTSRDAEKERADQLKKVSDFQSQMLAQIDTTKAGIDLMADVRERFVAALEESGVPEADRTKRLDALRQELVRVNATDAAAAMIDRTILRPAIKAVDEQFGSDPTSDSSLRQALTKVYHTIGLYDAALPLQESALATRRRVLGNEHPDTLSSMASMGVLLNGRGQSHDAERYLREAMETSRRVLGEEHPETLSNLFQLGVVLHDQGRTAEAEPYWREALAKRRGVLGEGHPETLNSLASIGGLLQSQLKLEEAEQYYGEVLDKSRRLLGEEDSGTIFAHNNMGVLLRNQGRLADAERHFREAADKSRRVFGGEHPDTLRFIISVGSVLQSQGKLSEALPYLREALETSQRVLGQDHPRTLDAMSNIGRVLNSQGKLQEAELYWREVLELRRRVLGEEHPNTLTSIGNLGSLLHAQGRLAEAESYLRDSLEKSRRVQGNEHPETLTAINNLGTLLNARGKLGEAEAYYREVVEKRRLLLGDDHPSTVASIYNMGVLLRSQGKLPEAEASLRESVEKSRRALGEEDPGTLVMTGNFARVLQEQGQHQAAIELLAPLEPAARAAFTRRDPRRLALHLTTLARARVGLGFGPDRFALAEANLLEAHPIYLAAKDRGPTHKDTLECVKGLVDLYTAWDKAEPGKGYDLKAAEWKAKLPAEAAPKP